MLLLGIDLGTSSVKVSVVDAQTQQCVESVRYPDEEAQIISPRPGWAEQSPDTWWQHVQQAILKINSTRKFDPRQIAAIGIAYQMHGLVCLDKQKKVLRNSIIWCDSRAVEIGDKAFKKMGRKRALSRLLNSPGNFTASKLAWVKENEPKIYSRIGKVMLPGDFISLQFTGDITTTVSALSEGIFWDFKKKRLSQDVMSYFGFDEDIIPKVQPVFSSHGNLLKQVADRLSLTPGIPVTYKAGDQPNNALSLNVLEPGEVAATAGTSGVIYGVSGELTYDPQSRVNSFAHVNHSADKIRTGVLLCINGTGILNNWVKKNTSANIGYGGMNDAANKIPIGSSGLRILPFGNGAERILKNKTIGAHFHHIDFNVHTQSHLFRAVQEGIACAFRYGLDIMRQNGMKPKIIRAGKSNMFLSPVFTEAFVNTTGVPVELYNCDGSIGAALGAGIGLQIYKEPRAAFRNMKALQLVKPEKAMQKEYEKVYSEWKKLLQRQTEENGGA